MRTLGRRAEGIEFHHDVDEYLCDEHDQHVHPATSTVTYLSDVGAPTLILQSLQGAHGPLSEGAISWPRARKHIAFDGRLLHGAVPFEALAASDDGASALPAPGTADPGDSDSAAAPSVRTTFLVNVWLDRRPHGVEELPASLAARLTASTTTAAGDGGAAAPPFRLDAAPPPPLVRIRRAAPSGVSASARDDDDDIADYEAVPSVGPLATLHVSFGRHSKEHALRVPLPPRPTGGGDATDAYLLRFDGDAPVAEVMPNTDAGLSATGRGKRDGPSERKAKKKKKGKRKRERAEEDGD